MYFYFIKLGTDTVIDLYSSCFDQYSFYFSPVYPVLTRYLWFIHRGGMLPVCNMHTSFFEAIESQKYVKIPSMTWAEKDLSISVE